MMYVLFFDSKGPIYQHFVPKVRPSVTQNLRNGLFMIPICDAKTCVTYRSQGTTVNTATYITMLKKFDELHRRKRPERFRDDDPEEWFFHQDNAPVR